MIGLTDHSTRADRFAMIINFGKHRREDLEDVPVGYVLFLAAGSTGPNGANVCCPTRSRWKGTALRFEALPELSSWTVAGFCSVR